MDNCKRRERHGTPEIPTESIDSIYYEIFLSRLADPGAKAQTISNRIIPVRNSNSMSVEDSAKRMP